MGFLSSLFGFDDAKPAQSTVVQATSIPEELKPFVTEVLESSQQQFQDDIAKGYTPFTGKTTADFTPEELQSMDRITGLAGVVDPYIREAEGISRQGAREFTGDEVQKYMSPYQQAVTDIEKREATRNFEGNILPRLEAQAVLQGGGQSGLGSRAAIELSEAQRNQAQLLADIQAKGQQTAYRDAQGLFANQLAREQQLASNLGTTGTALFQSGLAEAGALEGVGANKRSQEQNLLDEAFFRFKEEEAYPQQQLAEYTQNVYGNPVLGTPSRTSTTTGTPFQPSTGQNLLGLGLTGLNIYGMGGGFGAPNPNQFSLANIYNPPRRKAGGKVGGGLNSLPVVRKAKGDIGVPDYSYVPPSEFDFLDRDMSNIADNPMLQSSRQMMKTPRSQIMNTPEYGDLNRSNVVAREEKYSNLRKDLSQKSDAELDALDKAYFKGREANIKANPFLRAAAIQRMAAAIMTDEAGALTGAAKAAPKVFEELGKLDAALDVKKSKLEDDKFKIKREKITKRKQEGIDFVKEDQGLARMYDSLPAKAKERYLNTYKAIATLEISAKDKELRHRAALAKLKSDDRKYKLALAKYKNVDLKNIDIKKSQLIKDFRDLYYTDKDVAVTGLVQAGIDNAKIDFLIASVTATNTGQTKQSVPNLQTSTTLPNVPRKGRSSIQATINKIPNPIVSLP